MTFAESAVELRGLTHAYGTHQAVRGVSFAVRAGEIFGLLGPNGSGKSTLFRILSTQLRPTSGTATVFSRDVVRHAADVRRMIGIVFQNASLDGRLTAAENLMHHGHLHGVRGPELMRRIADALDTVGMSLRGEERVEKLSGGQQRRVEIAKALLHDTRLLLLDEPSTGLDPNARRDLFSHLVHLRDSAGVTSLLTTHLLEEAEHCDRIAILSRGRVVALGSPSDLKAKCGMEILVLDSPDPRRLQALIDESFRCQPTVDHRSVRVEIPAARDGDPAPGARLLREFSESFPKHISAARLGRPSLDDVYIRVTGRHFDETEHVEEAEEE